MEEEVITILAGVLLLIILVFIVKAFRWAVEKVPMHNHSWDKWMNDNCLCQRCSHIRALEFDLCLDGMTIDEYDQFRETQPTYVLTINEERGMLYSDLQDLSGNTMHRSLIGPAIPTYYIDTRIEGSIKR